MIIVNGKRLNPTDKSDRFVILYLDQIKLLKKLGKDRFTFNFPDNKIRVTEEGTTETSQGNWIPFRQKYVNAKHGEFDIIYAKTSIYDKNNREIYKPRYFDFKGPLTLKFSTNQELIWWIIFVCPNIELLDFIPEGELAQNEIRGTTMFKLDDKVRRAVADYSEKRKVADAMGFIYNPAMGLTGDSLLYVAKSYGIACEALKSPGKDDYNYDAIRGELGGIVLATKKNGKPDINKINEFLDMVPKTQGEKPKEEVISLAVVTDLLEMGMIQQAQSGQKQGWFSTEGNNLIMKFHPNDDAKAALVTWFTKNADIRQGFEKRVRDRKEEEAKAKSNIDD